MKTTFNYNFDQSIRIEAPGTVANLVCGFDILGLCLHEPFDHMEMRLLPEKKIVIHSLDEYRLPAEPAQNTAGAALIDMMEKEGIDCGFEVWIRKQIKPGSGLGSSAASAAGAVAGANYLLGNPFSSNELVSFAMAGEKLASGVKHADNVAPCIMGGITLVRGIFPLDIVKLDHPPLFLSVVHPQIEVKTSDARQVLRKQVALKDAIRQWGNIAGLVAGLLQKDIPLIGRSLEDVIIEPARSMLIPGFDDVKKNALAAGALGGGISGSGPSLFMLSDTAETATRVKVVMEDVFEKIRIPYHSYLTTINDGGIRIEEMH